MDEIVIYLNSYESVLESYELMGDFGTDEKVHKEQIFNHLNKMGFLHKIGKPLIDQCIYLAGRLPDNTEHNYRRYVYFFDLLTSSPQITKRMRQYVEDHNMNSRSNQSRNYILKFSLTKIYCPNAINHYKCLFDQKAIMGPNLEWATEDNLASVFPNQIVLKTLKAEIESDPEYIESLYKMGFIRPGMTEADILGK